MRNLGQATQVVRKATHLGSSASTVLKLENVKSLSGPTLDSCEQSSKNMFRSSAVCGIHSGHLTEA